MSGMFIAAKALSASSAGSAGLPCGGLDLRGGGVGPLKGSALPGATFLAVAGPGGSTVLGWATKAETGGAAPAGNSGPLTGDTPG
jgi:hypothetical protein